MIDIDIKEERHVNVDVHCAPTDESVRLLREMEAKAEAAIVSRTRVTNTHFECVVDAYLDNLNDTMKYRAIFSLNGHKMTADIERPRLPERDATGSFELLRDEIASVLANEILNKSFVELMMRNGKGTK